MKLLWGSMRSRACLWISGALLVCSAAWHWQGHTAESVPEMLERLAASADPEALPFLNDIRVERFAAKLDRTRLGSLERAWAVEAFAEELLRAGQSEQAVQQWGRVLALRQSGFPGRDGSRGVSSPRMSLALSWLRLAEQQNCLTGHVASACILPIDGPAVHRRPQAASEAIRVLRGQLEDSPGDLSARWLMNLAYMSVGDYPAKVPTRFLIPPDAFRSARDMAAFTNVAPGLGLDDGRLSGGSIAEDFDQDGDIDLVVSSLGLRHPLKYYRNNGDGTFTERSREAGLGREWGGLNLQQTDYNNDGLPDIFVLRGGWFGAEGKLPKSLLKNLGGGVFTNVTIEAGMLSLRPTQTAVWADFDGDGWLDVFIGHETRGTDVHPCQLFWNRRDGSFMDCAVSAGAAVQGWVKGVAAGDFDNDGRPDLYLSLLAGQNVLLKNHCTAEALRFVDVSSSAGVREPEYSFPTWFFDYDQDGWEDLFVSGYRAANVGEVAADYLGMAHRGELPRLYRNQRNGTFRDATREAGLARLLLAMGSNWADFDHDGWPDFYLGTGEPDLASLMPNRLFRNTGGGAFEDVTTSTRVGHLQKGHGVSFADFDHDGDLDFYAVMGGAFSGDVAANVLFESPGYSNSWVKLELRGVKANRPGLGARLRLKVKDGGVERTVYHTVTTGGSFGASPFRQDIGLGKAVEILRLEIDWPGSGTRQVFENVPCKRLLRITEGASAFEAVSLKAFRFRGSIHGHEHAH